MRAKKDLICSNIDFLKLIEMDFRIFTMSSKSVTRPNTKTTTQTGGRFCVGFEKVRIFAIG